VPVSDTTLRWWIMAGLASVVMALLSFGIAKLDRRLDAGVARFELLEKRVRDLEGDIIHIQAILDRVRRRSTPKEEE
jgi:hypothetical protein